MLLTDKEAKELIKKALSFSKADSAVVTIKGGNSSNIRFAANSVTTSGSGDNITLDIVSNLGRKSGSASITTLDDSHIEEVVRTSEESAKLSQESKEFMPPLDEGMAYLKSKEFFESTANMSPSEMASSVSNALQTAEKKDLKSTGYFETDEAFTAIGNSNGLYAYHDNTFARFATTMRTKDGTGSSKIDKSFADVNDLKINELSERLSERSLLSQNPKRLEPGKYTAILDHAAVCDIVTGLVRYMDMRSADEGRSYFSNNGEGNKIGKKLCSEMVNLHSNPSDAMAPARPFTDYGYPVRKISWISNGVLENLFTSRYWAEKSGKEHVPYPTNLIMQGLDKSVEDLIASTERGVFVTRFWYIRSVDPRQMLLTGLTRDGVFLIENGRISYPVNNFRFNESPVNVLEKIIDMSTAEKVVGSENVNARTVVPAIKVRDFNFSTISDAV
jgi:predicted Zn-dependent protease